EANPSACTLLGYTREEILGRSVTDITDASFHDHIAPVWDEFLRGRLHEGEWPLRRKDGAVRITEFRAVANVLPGVPMSAFRDVTASRESADKLRRSERQLAAAEQIAHVGSWEWDVGTRALRWS